jgi:hypothetical protein
MDLELLGRRAAVPTYEDAARSRGCCAQPLGPPVHMLRFLAGADGAGRPARPTTFVTTRPDAANVATVVGGAIFFAALRCADGGIETGELKAICCAT